MSVAWVQSIAPFANGSGVASGSFTTGATSNVLVIFSDDGAGTTAPTYSGTGSGTWVTQYSSTTTNGHQAGVGYNLGPISTGSQTVTITDVLSAFPAGFPFEYSGVSSISNGSALSTATPGTGTGAILGTSIVVNSGSVLLALCFDSSGSGTITSPAGTNRGAGTLGGRYYRVTEYAGTGAAIQPSFTSTAGGTDTFVVIQAIAAGVSLPVVNPTGPMPKQIYVMP